MKRITVIALGLFVLSVSFIISGTSEASMLSVTAMKVTKSPKIDGNLNDSVWSKTTWNTGFGLLGQPDKQADPQTRFKVVFDDKNIYFAVECFEPLMDKLRVQCKERDSGVWGDDCIEIFLGLSSDQRKYVHIVVNSIGTVADADYDEGGRRNTGWNSEGEVAARVGRKSWTVELSMPFYELGIDSEQTGSGFINIARERQAGGKELSSFAPLAGGFHNPSVFAQLKLPGADLSRYSWNVIPLFDKKIISNAFHAETRIINNTGKFYAVEIVPVLELGGKRAQGKITRDMLDKGQTHEHTFAVPLPGNGHQMLNLVIRNVRSKEIYLKKITPMELNYAPIEVTMKKPYWRNTIYSKQQIKNIEFHLKLLIPEKELTKMTACFSLQTKGKENKEVIYEKTEENLLPEFNVTLPARGLKIGEYGITITLLDSSGNTIHETTESLRKLPPSPSGVEWWFNEDGVLFRNNEKFLPYGYYTLYPARMDVVKDEGFCTAVLWYGVSGLDKYLEKTEAAKMAVVAYASWYQETKATKSKWTKLMTAEEINKLETHIKKLASYPSMMAWYLADEPGSAHVPRMIQTRNILSAVDPYRPTIILLNGIKATYKFGNSADIIMNDPYPGFKIGGLDALPIETVSRFVKAGKKATEGKRPVWTTLQGFSWGISNRFGERAPDFIEARNMNYQAVIAGATGFLWYADVYAKMSPSLDMAIPFIGKEMQLLKDYVLSKDVPGAVSIEAPEAEHIHVSWRKSGRNWVLFVVNTATKEQDVRFAFKSSPGKKIFVVSEDRKIKMQGSSFTDTFKIYDTHIYTNVHKSASVFDIEATVRKTLAADKARKKQGNLAFEDSGVKITSPAQHGRSTYLQSLVDGMADPDIGGGLYRSHVKNTPAWLVMKWPDSVEINRLVLYNVGTKLDFEIQVPGHGDSWQTISSTTGAVDDIIEVKFDRIKTTKIRLYLTKFERYKSMPRKYYRISEIEVYNR